MTVSPQGVPAELKGRELQWEPVLHFSNKGRLKGLAGLHYFRSKQDEWVDIRSVGGRNTFDDRNQRARPVCRNHIQPQRKMGHHGRRPP